MSQQLPLESDPLLEFSIESGGAAAPTQLEQPVAAARVADAEAMRARIDRLEKTIDRNTRELAALKSHVATLVSSPPNKRHRLVSALVAVALGVALGARGWMRMSNAGPPLLPVIGTPPLAEPSIVQAAALIPADLRQGYGGQATPEVQPHVVPAPTTYVGTLSIDSDPPADVFIDRKPAGRTPMRAANLKAGSHLIWIERDGYHRFTRVVQVPADRISRLVADLEPVAQR